MRIYLAAAFLRYPEMQAYRDQLHARGHVVTARWVDGTEPDDGNLMSGPSGDLGQFAVMDLTDIQLAECMISFTDGARARGGRHAEFGYGYAIGLRMMVVGPREHIFHHLPGVEHYETWAEALDAIVPPKLEAAA